MQQQNNGQYFKVQTYTQQDGLPDAVVYDAVQDSSGMMWFVGRKGIFTYDGNKFELFADPEVFGENPDYISLKIDSLNIIWALPGSSFQNIVFYKDGAWNKIPAVNSPSQKQFSGMALDFFDLFYEKGELRILLASKNKIWIYSNDKWTENLVGNINELGRINFVTVFNNQFYVSTNHGIFTLFDSRLNSWHRLNRQLPDKNIQQLSFLSTDKEDYPNYGILGTNWVGYVNRGEFEQIPVSFTLPILNYRTTTFLTYDNTDRLYFGNQSALFVYSNSDKSIMQLDSRNGLTTNGATSVFNDRERNIWITSFRGISKVPNTPFLNYNKSAGLPENETSTVKVLRDSRIFLGHNNGYSIIQNNRVVYSKSFSSGENVGQYSRVMDAAIDNKGLLWVVSAQKGLAKLVGNKLVGWFKSDEKREYHTVAINDEGEILVGTDKGLYKFNGSKLNVVKGAAEDLFIRKIVKDSKGNAILCTNMFGLVRYEDENIAYFKNVDPKSDNVYNALNVNGKIFVGSIGGLYIVDGDSLKKFISGNFHIDRPVYFIIEDNDSNIWFGLDNGVIRWNGINSKQYSIKDGLAGYETNRSAVALDETGRLWIGTNKGLSIYLKEYDKIPSMKPILELSNLEDSDGNLHEISKPINLDNDQNYFTINFRALTYIDEKSTKYHVAIVNLDDSKVDSFTTVERWARFSNVSHGVYKFRIQAENIRHVLSDIKTSAVITIKPPYYLQFWFFILSSIIVAFVFYNVFKYFNQKRRSEELERMVKERTKSLEDSQKQLIESEKRYKGLIESQNEMIVRVDNQNRFTFVNDAYCRVFGKSAAELIGKTFIPLVHPDDRNKTLDIMKDLDKPPYRVYLEQRALTKNGWRWLSWEDYAIRDENGVTIEIQAIGRDITDKMYADKIRTHAIFEAVEKERSRISRDLHDDLGQILTGAKLKLEMVKKNSPPLQSESYQDVVEMIGSVGKHLRNIVHDLHPTEIARYGLFPAIESLCFQMQKISGIKINYDYADFKGKWDNKHDLMIYRIVQESLNNVIKHSKSKTAKVYFSGNNTEVNIEVEDSGIGFDTTKLHSIKNIGSGFGLINIQQRVELIGGRMNIVSDIGRGTKLIVNIIRESQSE